MMTSYANCKVSVSAGPETLDLKIMNGDEVPFQAQLEPDQARLLAQEMLAKAEKIETFRDYEKMSAELKKAGDKLKATPHSSSTVFECRCCDRLTQGTNDGTMLQPGWSRIEHIDGPDAICPYCIDDPNALDALHLDGYPDARVQSREELL